MRYRFWTVRIKAVQNWRCKTSGCALPFLVRQSYSRTILAVQNLRAVGYRFWSVRVTALHYWRCKTFGLWATVSGPSELQPYRTGGAKPSGCALPVPVRQGYSHTKLAVQNLWAVRCQCRSVSYSLGSCTASTEMWAWFLWEYGGIWKRSYWSVWRHASLFGYLNWKKARRMSV